MPALSASADERVRGRLRIGEWSVDPATNELSRGSEAVRIEPKAMDVLMLLVRRVGHVVSREEFFAAVWPGTVVGDEALTQSIIKLRRALGDNSRSPVYIETISKRGYRLVASVWQGESARVIPAGTDVGPPPQFSATTRLSAAWVGLLAGFLLIVALVGVYWFGSIAPAPDAEDDGDARQPAWVTITILPFEPLGPDREQAYLARGISDSLMTDLSRLSGLRLIRDSGAPRTGPTAASARYRVSGSVQRDSETLRINIYLADTKTGEQLWAGRFERPFGDLFAVQDEITARLVELLPGKVSDVERQRLAKRYTRSLAAYDYFLRGKASFLVRREEENDEARAFYRKALELDPRFARAYASLAMTYAMDYRLRASANGLPALDRAFELAETARLIDPRKSIGRSALFMPRAVATSKRSRCCNKRSNSIPPLQTPIHSWAAFIPMSGTRRSRSGCCARRCA